MAETSPGLRRALLVAFVAVPLVLSLVMLAPALAQVTGSASAARAPAAPEVMKWGFVAAALASGLSAIGAAYAVAVVGGAAMGAVAEKPETAGRALVFVGLAEGIAIYGLIIAIMILGYL
jgi:V/A-type H+-transporting ATPase subunit K